MRENQGFAVVCGLLGVTLLVGFYSGEHSDSAVDLLLFLASLVTWFVLALVAIYRVFKRNHLPWERRLAPFYLLAIPLAFVLAWNIGNGLLHEQRDWLVVESYDFTGSNILLFRKDGEYQYRRGSPLGHSAPVAGRYERRDSLLILQPAPGEIKPIIAKLAIRPYTQFEKHRDNSSVRLVALDSAGNGLAAFRITQRNY